MSAMLKSKLQIMVQSERHSKAVDVESDADVDSLYHKAALNHCHLLYLCSVLSGKRNDHILLCISWRCFLYYKCLSGYISVWPSVNGFICTNSDLPVCIVDMGSVS